LSHGDTRHPVLFPSDPAECFSMAGDAFDLAEQFQTPVFVNSDLDLGMNNWMADPFEYPTKDLNRGKVLDAEALDKVADFGRYRDVDGDGIPYRTLPGTKHPRAAYFTRGSGHNDRAGYTEREDDYVNNVDRLSRKFETMKQWIPAPEVHRNEKATIGLVYCGTTRWAVEESRDQLTREYGVETSYMRLKGYPFTQELEDFIAAHDHVYVCFRS
jgi:2-oxoglutarate ferredoxin oxidoreductase subunit alpha